MMNDEQILNEKINVIALFKPGRTMCEPIKFKRANGREIIITEIGLRHPVKNGTELIHIFDVTSGEADYRLELNAKTLVWRLTMESDKW